MDLHHVPGLPPSHEKRLREAGIANAQALGAADLAALAARTGIPEARLRAYAASAGAAGAGGQADTPRASQGHERAHAWKVTLKEKVDAARVTVGNVVYENVPVVLAKAQEAEARLARELRTNAVVLREKADVARVRIGETWQHDVPIFQERVRSGAQRLVEEVRVRIKEIRENSKKE